MKKAAAGQSRDLAHRSEADRELAILALQPGPWDTAYIARKFPRAAITATREALAEQLRGPLKHHEPKLNGSLTAQVRAHLNTIGAAVRPDFTAEQAKTWTDALLIKLSDLPAPVAIKASARALHVPFEFPGQVEAKLRELADEHMTRQREALAKLREAEQAIYDAANPKPRLTGPEPVAPGDHVIDTPLAHLLQKTPGMCRSVWQLGRTLKYITDDQVLDEPDSETSQPQSKRKEPSHEF